MQGEKIGSESGKVTSQRVLPNPGGGPKMETSFQATGTLLGVSHTTTATYCAVVRGDGTLYGEGQAVVMGKGGEMATWVGQGVGTIKNDGSVSYRGAVSCLVAPEQCGRHLRVRDGHTGQLSGRELGVEVTQRQSCPVEDRR